jgi:hypothetical protein
MTEKMYPRNPQVLDQLMDTMTVAIDAISVWMISQTAGPAGAYWFHVNRRQICLNGRHPRGFPFNAWTARMDNTHRPTSEDVIALQRPVKDDRMSAGRERVDMIHKNTQPFGSHSHEILAFENDGRMSMATILGYIRNGS